MANDREIAAITKVLYHELGFSEIPSSHFVTIALSILAALDAVRVEMKPEAGDERDELRGVLRRARGWAVTCSESAQARADIRAIDAVLVGTDHSADAGKVTP